MQIESLEFETTRINLHDYIEQEIQRQEEYFT